jgi:hypothetical protein
MEFGTDAEVMKVQDMETIANYEVLALPAFARNVPEVEEIKGWIK